MRRLTSQARTGTQKLGLGRQKIFEVRRIHNDLTFIDAFLTLDFCREHKLFSFGYNAATDYYEIESREFPKIKQQLLFNLTNLGRPIIYVTRRQLQEPRRAVPGAPVQRRRAESQATPATRWRTCTSSGGGRCISRPCSRAPPRCFRSTARNTRPRRMGKSKKS